MSGGRRLTRVFADIRGGDLRANPERRRTASDRRADPLRALRFFWDGTGSVRRRDVAADGLSRRKRRSHRAAEKSSMADRKPWTTLQIKYRSTVCTDKASRPTAANLDQATSRPSGPSSSTMPCKAFGTASRDGARLAAPRASHGGGQTRHLGAGHAGESLRANAPSPRSNFVQRPVSVSAKPAPARPPPHTRVSSERRDPEPGRTTNSNRNRSRPKALLDQITCVCP